MTEKQRIHLMAELWPAAAAALGCRVQDRERRLEVISQALGRQVASANEVNDSTDFDLVKGAMLALSKPADVAAQLRQIAMAKTRLKFAIQKLMPEAYWRAVARNKFHTEDLEELNEAQLTQLRNTLAARANAKRKKTLATVPAEEGNPF